ncbi:MAG: histone deacetylase [Proteobacteria bacterium]|nr:histone deacetylase [Pseudomonadota bacterium]
MNKRVGLVVDDRLLKHAIPRHSPENPARIRNLSATVRERYRNDCIFYQARTATVADIEAVHSRFYLEQLREHQIRSNPYSYDRDTYLMEHSMATAELAAGGCLELADQIMKGGLDQGFAMIRPPGHHAEPGRGSGFCIFNNVAVTAEYLRRRYHLSRILIVDFDAHHGNGTQEVFYDNDEVLVLSLHQRDIFPFTGKAGEIGTGKGEGYTINVPVFAQFGDVEYTFLLGRILQSVVEQYLPQIILVSAGFDGHRDETISGTTLTTEGFGLIAAMLKQYAQEICGGRLLMVLEGGYNPESLEASVVATIDSLLTSRRDKIGVYFSERANQLLKDHPLHNRWTLQ